jgi:hypothetical protein
VEDNQLGQKAICVVIKHATKMEGVGKERFLD